MKLSDLGERSVVSEILRRIAKVYPTNSLPLGDDAAAVEFCGSWLILKVDGSSARSSKYEWMSWSDFGWRMALAAVTDVIAKGGYPRAILSSIGVPRDYEASVVYDIVDGITELATLTNSYVLGGDVNEAYDDVWVDITVLGISRRLIPIKGLTPGDKLFVTGCLGLSAIPYIIYLKKLDPTPWSDVLKAIWRPRPVLEFLSIAGNVKASTDISDGFLSVIKMLEVNNVGLRIDNVPLCPICYEFIRETGVDMYELLKYLGEEYQITFALHDSNVGGNYHLLGMVTSEKGVKLQGRDIRFGWEYFKGFHE